MSNYKVITKSQFAKLISEMVKQEIAQYKEEKRCDDRDILLDDELFEEAPPGQKYEDQILAMKKRASLQTLLMQPHGRDTTRIMVKNQKTNQS